MPRIIAIVEDQPAIAAHYRDAFERDGFVVRCYPNRGAAMAGFRLALPDLVVIDIGLGDEVEGGFELCRQLRVMAPQLPIIFLTARNEELDVISGLRLGADDYLSTGISIAYMMARVHALLRWVDSFHQPQGDADAVLERGDLSIHMDRMLIIWKGQEVALTVTQFWIVHSLAHYPGQVRSRQQLMDAARTVLDNNTITSHIKRIRRRFLLLDPGFAAIETVYGMGYRWRVGGPTIDGHSAPRDCSPPYRARVYGDFAKVRSYFSLFCAGARLSC